MTILIKQVASNAGIGQVVSRQKILFTEQENARLVQAEKFYEEFIDFANIGYLNVAQESALRKKIIKIGLGLQKLALVSIFCPSYKTGAGIYGYNNKIGNKTRENINTLVYIANLAKKYDIKSTITILFSDLILENLHELKGTSYADDLHDTFLDLLKNIPPDFNAIKLSSIHTLADTLGEEGTSIELIKHSPSDLNIVKMRNRICYAELLGWSDEMSDARSEQLAIAYPYLAAEINRGYPDAIYFWSESAIERTRLMPNLEVPLFVPRKVRVCEH